MKIKTQNEARSVEIKVEWLGGDISDRCSFFMSLGLDPERWQEEHRAQIAPDTEFEVFGLKMKPCQIHAMENAWNCRFERFDQGWKCFFINDHLVVASLEDGAERCSGPRLNDRMFSSLQGLRLPSLYCLELYRVGKMDSLVLLQVDQNRHTSELNILGVLKRLQSLHLLNCRIPPDLSALECLLELKISGLRLIDDLNGLASLTNLVRLDLTDGWGVKNLTGLEKLENLRNLSFSGCVQLRDFSHLGYLQRLEVVDLSHCDVRDLSPLQHQSGLRSLDLSGCRSLRDFQGVGSLTGLTSLNLGGSEKLSMLSDLQRLTALERLELASCRHLEDLSGIERMARLQYLDLKGCNLLANLGPLENLTALTRLDLGGCKALSDLRSIRELSGLKWLNLSKLDSLADLEALQKLSGLCFLSLAGCRGVSDLSPLKGHGSLCSLDLQDCAGVNSIEPLRSLMGLGELNLKGSGVLNPKQLEHLLSMHSLEILELDRRDLQLMVLLKAAQMRKDAKASGKLLCTEESLKVLKSSLDRELASCMAEGICLASTLLPSDFAERFLFQVLEMSTLSGEDWFRIIDNVARGCPGSMSDWLGDLGDKEAIPAGLLSGLLRFVAEGKRLGGVEWKDLLAQLLGKTSLADQIELGPSICLAWCVIGETWRKDQWLKRLTAQAAGGFADRVRAQFALHDIRKGDMVSATKLLGKFEKGDSGDADTVRRALARALAATAPEDAGRHMAGVYDEADRKALAGELMAVPGFTQVEANLSRLITILGTDPDRFHRLVDLMLTQNPDSQWVEELRCQLSPPDDRGIAEVLVAILSRPEVRQRTKEKKLEALQSKLLQDSGWVKRVLESTAILLLKSEGLVDAGEAAELRALITPKGEKEFI